MHGILHRQTSVFVKQQMGELISDSNYEKQSDADIIHSMILIKQGAIKNVKDLRDTMG